MGSEGNRNYIMKEQRRYSNGPEFRFTHDMLIADVMSDKILSFLTSPLINYWSTINMVANGRIKFEEF